MRRLPLLLFVLAVLVALPSRRASAQQISPQGVRPAETDDREAPRSGPMRIHVSDDLLRSPEGQAALKNFQRAKSAGLLTMKKSAARVDTIGQERNFNVLINLLDESTKTWTPLNFTLRATNDVANVWIETSLDGTFSTDRMNELLGFILDGTPDASYRPDRGIIENDNEIFGMPPNYDGDGSVDILLHDIQEGNDDCCVLGYVSSVDVNPSAPAGNGNQRDVLYVDLPDGLNNGGVISISGTIAHEYQHLIHLAHGPELTFVNEGLSEWAEIMNGFFLRTIDYLQNVDEHNTSLLEFRVSSSVSVRDNDYQRAGLFTTYIADRIGWEATGGIVSATAPGSSADAYGADGYAAVLDSEGLTLEEIVADFHAANFVNDEGLDPRFGYSLVQRQTLSARSTTVVDGALQSSVSTPISVSGGAVHYLTWENVADLDLNIAATSSGSPRSRTQFRLHTVHSDGTREVSDLSSLVEAHQVTGDFKRATLIVANVDARDSSPVAYTVSSEWSPGSGAFVQETVAYENGETAGQPYFTLDEANSQASRFDVPANARLASVLVAPVYTNQFIGTDDEPLLPPGLPRDFELQLMADDGTGRPGAVLFSKQVVDDPSGSHLDFGSGAYDFLEIELPSDEPALGDLPSTVFIGMANAGTDENYLALTTASLIGGEDRSFVVLSGSWAPFSAIVDGETNEPVLEGRVLPIRAQFIVPTADESDTVLPAALKLLPNYPNPFNPTTRIAFELPQTSHVRLAVHDLLGRRVAILVDGVRSAGRHTSVVDASGWSSGSYFYTLEANGRRVTRRMIVLK